MASGNKSAAGLRRSAIAERVRLRAEWAELKGTNSCSDVLRGLVILVEVGPGSRALALRSALSALGASVVPSWVPLVTHVVWAAGGCRKVRAKARALACRLVSPLWVEGCASSGRRLPEAAFPAATRPSDLPSPATLRRLLVSGLGFWFSSYR
ncbi:microcephalin-like [Plutella xylostella]|uniref:microcephalin-like n=1 Tax=Plutella xylostella TaxID=51655 RepID=UPI0020325FAE|nr:microcephalin-like [Plutella xylostella]